MANESQGSGLNSFDAMKQESTSLFSRDGLLARLRRGRDARSRFVESHLNKTLAFQTRALRDREDWSQAELAAKVGMTQNQISRLENPRYGKATITTLKRVAAAFDVALVVRFVPFSQLANWVSGTAYVEKGLSPQAFDIPSFAVDEERNRLIECRAKENETAISRLVEKVLAERSRRRSTDELNPFARGMRARFQRKLVQQRTVAALANIPAVEPKQDAVEPKQEVGSDAMTWLSMRGVFDTQSEERRDEACSHIDG